MEEVALDTEELYYNQLVWAYRADVWNRTADG